MRLVTWNINSVRLRLEQVKKLVDLCQPDILCLQEIKCENGRFPARALGEMGFFHQEINGQKGYHGVATLSRVPIRRVATEDFDETGEARHLAVELEKQTGCHYAPVIHNFYVPAGGDKPDPEENPRFFNKLKYLKAMQNYFGSSAQCGHGGDLLLVGDLNIAPLETDVWSHKQLLKVVSHTPVEVTHLEDVQRAGDWVDVMRRFVPKEEKLFTWWSYRAKDFRKSNRGRRLDHIWASAQLGHQGIVNMEVLDEVRGWTRPSDHAPVLVDF